MDFYLGMIFPWAINFEPEGFMLCDGRTLPIQQYSALYSLLGTYFGGDGVNNFKIPDLRGRVLLGAGSGGPAFGTTSQTTSTGTATGTVGSSFTLNANNIPSHAHTFTGTASTGDIQSGTTSVAFSVPASNDAASGTATNTPSANAIFGVAKTTAAPFPGCNVYRTGATKNIDMCSGTASGTVTGSVSITPAGTISSPTTQPAPVSVTGNVTINYPFTGINYFICIQGLYPIRQ